MVKVTMKFLQCGYLSSTLALSTSGTEVIYRMLKMCRISFKICGGLRIESKLQSLGPLSMA